MILKHKQDKESKVPSQNNSQTQPHGSKNHPLPTNQNRYQLFGSKDLARAFNRPSSSYSHAVDQEETEPATHRLYASLKNDAGMSRQASDQQVERARFCSVKTAKKASPSLAKIRRYESHSIERIQDRADRKVHRDSLASEKHHTQKLKNIRGYKPEKAQAHGRIQSVATYLHDQRKEN